MGRAGGVGACLLARASLFVLAAFGKGAHLRRHRVLAAPSSSSSSSSLFGVRSWRCARGPCALLSCVMAVLARKLCVCCVRATGARPCPEQGGVADAASARRRRRAPTGDSARRSFSPDRRKAAPIFCKGRRLLPTTRGISASLDSAGPAWPTKSSVSATILLPFGSWAKSRGGGPPLSRAARAARTALVADFRRFVLCCPATVACPTAQSAKHTKQLVSSTSAPGAYSRAIARQRDSARGEREIAG